MGWVGSQSERSGINRKSTLTQFTVAVPSESVCLGARINIRPLDPITQKESYVKRTRVALNEQDLTLAFCE